MSETGWPSTVPPKTQQKNCVLFSECYLSESSASWGSSVMWVSVCAVVCGDASTALLKNVKFSCHSIFFHLAQLLLKSSFQSFESLFVFLSLTSLPAYLFSLTFSSPSSLYNPALSTAEGEGEVKGREGLRSMSGLRTQRPAAGWIGVIDQAESICSARLLGLCGWRLFLNYYRRQMLVRRCSLSRLDCFSAAWFSPSLSPSVTLCFLYLLKFCYFPLLYHFFLCCYFYFADLHIAHCSFIIYFLCSLLFQ